MNNPFILSLILFLISFNNIISQNKNKILEDHDKEFLALKITKIQADYDDLINIHDGYQIDSLEYTDRGDIIKYISSTGNNCFDKENIYDVPVDVDFEKISDDSTEHEDYTIYRAYRYLEGKHYSIAIDNQSYIFLLHNFWKDEFKRFIIKKYGLIDDINKALKIVSLYLNTKLYDPVFTNQIIIDSLNYDQYRNELAELEPLKWQNKNNEYYFSFYTISRYDEAITYYNITITRNCDITHSSKLIKYTVRD